MVDRQIAEFGMHQTVVDAGEEMEIPALIRDLPDPARSVNAVGHRHEQNPHEREPEESGIVSSLLLLKMEKVSRGRTSVDALRGPVEKRRNKCAPLFVGEITAHETVVDRVELNDIALSDRLLVVTLPEHNANGVPPGT